MFFIRKKKLVKRITVYVSDKYQQIIIAPRNVNKAGIIYEQESCEVFDKGITDKALGEGVINNLNKFSFKEQSLQESKLTDWPAFKHGKSKSVKAFEQEYINISINGCNEHNMIIDIEGLPYRDSQLTIKSTISFYADKGEIGKRIMKVYEACISGKI
ncbi:MAG: hypothetical protein J7604_18625 [Sporocytophaga sp.]|uniref:hypothetical protein n=1 Tax=Sporocytophaga sp. TaxID=2231183 RepID=UPI001B268831|nr:hypothetical protein [Sporocytophaga sp.]MBO9702231.1 hypothetical protein [Sporocytophaga sp.]